MNGVERAESKIYLNVLNVDAAHDGASVFDFLKSSSAVGKFGRVVMVDDADDLHSRLRGRASPDGRSAGVVTAAAEAVRLPLAAGLTGGQKVGLDRLVLASVRRQVGRRRRCRHLVDHWHRVGEAVDGVGDKKRLVLKLFSLGNLFR